MTLTARINIRLHHAEKKEIKEDAASAGLTVSDFVRKKCTGVRVTSHMDRKCVRELRGVHTDLTKLYNEKSVNHEDIHEIMIRIKIFLETLAKNRWGDPS